MAVCVLFLSFFIIHYKNNTQTRIDNISNNLSKELDSLFLLKKDSLLSTNHDSLKSIIDSLNNEVLYLKASDSLDSKSDSKSYYWHVVYSEEGDVKTYYTVLKTKTESFSYKELKDFYKIDKTVFVDFFAPISEKEYYYWEKE